MLNTFPLYLFGNVFISIKPVNGVDVSDFDKKNILDSLKSYTIAGVNQQIVDLKVLYVEIESSIYYDNTKVDSGDSLKTSVITSLNRYAKSVDLSRFGGRFKYSKCQKVIDETDVAITSNITNVIQDEDLEITISRKPKLLNLCLVFVFMGFVNFYNYSAQKQRFILD